MSKMTTVVLLIILVAAGGIILFGKKSQAPATIENSSGQETTNPAPETTGPNNTPVIMYTDQGFVPATVEVSAGTTVNFINQSSGQMWVASNPHPVHTDLGGFDERQAVAKGGSYSYTFNTAGNWGFHNHMSPSATGTVIVK